MDFQEIYNEVESFKENNYSKRLEQSFEDLNSDLHLFFDLFDKFREIHIPDSFTVDKKLTESENLSAQSVLKDLLLCAQRIGKDVKILNALLDGKTVCRNEETIRKINDNFVDSMGSYDGSVRRYRRYIKNNPTSDLLDKAFNTVEENKTLLESGINQYNKTAPYKLLTPNEALDSWYENSDI